MSLDFFWGGGEILLFRGCRFPALLYRYSFHHSGDLVCPVSHSSLLLHYNRRPMALPHFRERRLELFFFGKTRSLEMSV
jgi:hypothetical protein